MERLVVARKSVHVGGQQLLLLVPKSGWSAPTELPDLRKHKRIALDTENRDNGLALKVGPGWATRNGHVCGLGIAWKTRLGYAGGYYPTKHPETPDQFTKDQIKRWLEDHIKAGVRFAFQNAPYDWGWIWCEFGVRPPDGSQIDDVGAMAMMIDENRTWAGGYSLDGLCEWQGLPGKDESLLEEAAAAYGYHGEDEVKSNLWRLPAHYVGPYGEADPIQTLRLADKLDPLLDKEDLRKAYQLECDLIPMTVTMRMRGIRVDTDYAEQAIVKLRKERDVVLRELSDKLGHTTGLDEIRSWRFMAKACDAHGVKYPTTAKGQPSFKKEWTRKHPHWLPRLSDRAEALEMMASKFMQGFILDYSHADAGGQSRLHATINQFLTEDGGTRSHRFSYADPALQQAPSRDEEFADMFRGALLPEEGEYWDSLDYSQQEYRLIVHYGEVHKCTRASEAADKYRTDPRTDFHTMVSEMTGLERKPAKDTNFAKAFGAGVPKFATMISKSVEEAEAIYRQYDEEMPFVSELAKKCTAAANQKGYILLIDGARSHFDLWEPADKKYQYDEKGKYVGPKHLAAAKLEERWEGQRLRRAYTHKAMNRKIQGSAARMTKLAMRECWRAGHVPLLQMHDELAFSHHSERQGVECQEIMVNAVKLTVPVVVDMEWGKSWGTAKYTFADMVKKFKTAATKRRKKS